ncbi:MAG: hypothetical protein HYV39_00135 [Candidatus Levybacteria bacterium]|nr:hypothetical protein [Candidatus Levybacteria bacterium]
MEKFAAFARIAEIEFSDIVLSTQDLSNKLRIYLKDTSFIDFFFTTKLQAQRFSIHWERRHVDASIFRLDNTPDKNWKKVETFPIHFHSKTYEHVSTPPFPLQQKDTLQRIFRKFLQFTRKNIV